MDAWQHTGAIWALLANINRDPRQQRRPFTGLEINPYAHLFPKPVEDRGISVGDPRMRQLFEGFDNGERR